MNSEEIKKRRLREKKAMLRVSHRKVGVAFFVFVVLFLVIIARILHINYTSGEEYSKIVLDHQAYTSTTIAYKRGQIQDRSGIVMAYSEKVYNLILDPKQVLSEAEYREPTISALVQCFGLNRSDLESILSSKPNSQYERLLRELTSDEIKEFQEMAADTENNPNIKGVWFEESYVRKYPFNSLACDVIGFASATNGGELGLESYYNDELSGTDGVSYSYVGEDLEVTTSEKAAVDGNNIVTTIDYKVQSIIEEKVAALNAERPSKATAVIAMDPNSGEILAMVNYPSFDLNNPRDLTGLYTAEELSGMSDIEMTTAMYSLWSNYCVSNIYEPGSTFKVFTEAEALEEGVTYDGDLFNCTGSEEVGGETIKCHVASTLGSHGILTLADALAQSCNPAMIQLSAKLGGKKMAAYQMQLGFGSKTGIDLPGEEAGLLQGDSMTALDAACNSFGQNLNVNMVQMAAAFSSIVNGGSYYQPHLVKRIEKSTGEVVKTIEPTLVRYTVTSKTSELMRSYLKNAVDNGLVKKAGVTGYSIGGKTGTAQKLPRSDYKWICSYIGCAPMDNPQIVLYVVIDEPYQTTGTGGTTNDALNLTHDIYEELLPYLNIYKDLTDEEKDTSTSSVESTVQVP
jgi:stage V sporulation protein D (sporulation-specific penicillin-binding protein)